METPVAWYTLHSHDVFVAGALSYALVELLVSWTDYRWGVGSLCPQPVQVWLLVACSTVALLRLVNILYDRSHPEDFSDLWCFTLFTTYPRIYALLIVAILYPFLVSWVVLGTIWYTEIQTMNLPCFKVPKQGWYFLVWLLIFYVWVVAYTVAILTSAMVWVKTRQYRRRQVIGIYQEVVGHFGEDHGASMHLALLDEVGLSPDAIGRLREFVAAEENCGTACSVCLEDMRVGEHIRLLPCSHIFHRCCVDMWLLRRAECPMCKFLLSEDLPYLAAI